MDIDWLSDESHVLLNPRMPEAERMRLQSFVTDLRGHLWLSTSGTTGALKLTALSKQAMLASAAAVNRHLQSTAEDVWCCVLPTFHVGGLGIHARAFLSGARVVTLPWDPHAFAAMPEMTLSSLVPAQVSDLVAARLQSPPSVRSIVVGGGALSADLYNAARELGWPLLPSYGMTETCSQVATATLASPELVLLDHVEARQEANGCLSFKGDSLLTGYGTETGFIDPTHNGWLATADLGHVEDRILRVEGRAGDFVKIGGESVDLARLDAILASIAGLHAAVVVVPDVRLGHVIHLAVAPQVDRDMVAAAFAERVHPFERPRAVHRVPEIPRTPLGKLVRTKLLEYLPKVVE
ncbi:MAG TPA: AMP-binding protein [Thermoanaerobaculia bacterium]|nr:AMP-binding protein [Thermoanaerobaculia bacterium]